MKMDPHKELLQIDLSPYQNEWIAVCDSKVISHGKGIKEVFYDAKKKCPGKNPYLAKIPGKETWIF